MTEAGIGDHFNRVFIGVGSNLENPVYQVKAALDRLPDIPRTANHRRSRLYRNPPMGPKDQPDFVNAVAYLETAITPDVLLDGLQQIEDDAGRHRTAERWGPRIIDLDLLMYGDVVVASERLTIPHPGITERPFVLIPLLDLCPDLTIPGHGPVRVLVSRIRDPQLEAIPDGGV